MLIYWYPYGKGYENFIALWQNLYGFSKGITDYPSIWREIFCYLAAIYEVCWLCDPASGLKHQSNRGFNFIHFTCAKHIFVPHSTL